MSRSYREHIVSNDRRAHAMALFVSELVSSDTYPGLIFVKELAHANFLAEVLSEVLGVDVPAVSAQVPQHVRDAYLDRMRQEDPTLPVCVTTAVWATGIDVPSLRWGLVAGAGKAPIGLRQQAGRLTRTYEGKAKYTLYHWVDKGVEAYERQSEQALQHYARSGFTIAGQNPSVSPTISGNPATDLLERILDRPESPRADCWGPEEVLTTSGKLADAMCQSPEGFILLMVFYALCGVGGFTLLLAILKLLLFGPT